MEILLIGDSHTAHIKKFNNPYINITTLKIGGATAQGLLNYNSSRKTLTKILKFFNTHDYKKYNYIFLCFGEVDCNSAIWYYKNKYKTSLNTQLDRSIDNYENFIKTYILTRFNKDKIILMSPILPNVPDSMYNKQRPSLRTEMFINQQDRTMLTDKFSQKLLQMANKNNYTVITINDKLRDINTGLIKEKYFTASAHLPSLESINLWGEEFIKIIKEKNEQRK